MAKLVIKSDNITPFGGLYSIFNAYFDWNNIQIAYLGEGNEKWEGKSIAQCAREMGNEIHKLW